MLSGLAIKALLCALNAIAIAAESSHLQLTALVSDDDGTARFECWKISTPFSHYPTVGEAIPGLAQVDNVSYVVLPPRSNEGLHNPPFPMFFVLLSGLAHVTLPQGHDELWIMEGVNGLMIAADVIGDGHFTEYPSDKDSVALQIPFREGKMPEHSVLKQGVCDLHSMFQKSQDRSLDQKIVQSSQ